MLVPDRTQRGSFQWADQCLGRQMGELLVSSGPALKKPPDDRKTGCLVHATKHSHCRADGLSSVVFVEESLEKFLDVIYLFTWCFQNVTVVRRAHLFLPCSFW